MKNVKTQTFRFLLLSSMLFFAACFSVEEPIISSAQAVAIPSGAGIYSSIDKKSGEEKILMLTRLDSTSFSYGASSKDKDGSFNAIVRFLRVGNGKYIVQIETTDDDALTIMVAKADAKTIVFSHFDETQFSKILTIHNITLVKKIGLFADHSKANEQIKKLRDAQATFAVETFGIKLFGDQNEILAVTQELAKSTDFNADEDSIVFTRKN